MQNRGLDIDYINNDDNINKKKFKKRGRPPKNTSNVQSQNKNKNEDVFSVNKEKPLIIELDNTSSDNSTNYNENNDFNLSKNNLSDTCHKPSEYSVAYLLSEGKKKDTLIKNLKETIDKYNLNKLAQASTNSILPVYYSLKIIDENTKEPFKILDKTDIACWWCTYQFSTSPVFLPIKYTQNTYYVMGCFCSFGCTASYNLSLNDSGFKTREMLIKQLFYKIYGDNIVLKYAPKREILTKFGGPITIEKFRESLFTPTEDYYLKLPPMNPMTYCLEITNSENKVNC